GGVREQRRGDEVGPVRLVLELRHAAELPERRGALHDPAELGVLGDLALGEQRADVGIEAGGDQQLRELGDLGAQLGRVLRDRQRVEVDHAVHGIVRVLLTHPTPDRTQVVAEVDVAGRLDAGEHAGHGSMLEPPRPGLRTGSEPASGRPPRSPRVAWVTSPAMSYAVQTPVFEGPFDLLLHLILREQVDIYEVSLSTITDGYLAHIEAMADVDLEVASEFLLIAATLVELKSRRLLPSPEEMDLDEELALWEERDLLLHRLVECKTFKDAAVVLSALAADAGRSRPRT